MTIQPDVLAELEAEHTRDGIGTDADRLRTELTKLWGGAQTGISVVRAEMHGRGPGALVVVHLSDGRAVEVERFADLLQTGRLAALVISTTGVAVTFKPAECARVAAMLYRLAEHHEQVTADDIAREWGIGYLRAATDRMVDLNDQDDRWSAFAAVDRLDPLAIAREKHCSVATASIVLHTVDGTRYVHSGWFLAHVRRDVGTIGAPELVNRMSRAGWQRRGKRGRIKATSTGFGGTIQLPLYIVPKDWEHQ